MPRPGYIPTEETRRKISLANKGRKLSKQTRENISRGRKGIKFSKEHINNMRIAAKKIGNEPPHYKGKRSPCWKGGLPKCVDCGKRVKVRKATRCKKCNVALGMVGDSIETLKLLIKYLQSSQN